MTKTEKVAFVRRALRYDVSWGAVQLRDQPPGIIRLAIELESSRRRPRVRLLSKLRKMLHA